jgi:competence protein ComGC
MPLKESIMKLGNTSGFTLIELTIVLAGFVLVVISMLPAVQRNDDGRIDCGLTPTECQMTVGPGGGK